MTEMSLFCQSFYTFFKNYQVTICHSHMSLLSLAPLMLSSQTLGKKIIRKWGTATDS